MQAAAIDRSVKKMDRNMQDPAYQAALQNAHHQVLQNPQATGGECLEFFDRVFLNTFEIFANWKFWNWSRDLCGALAFHIF